MCGVPSVLSSWPPTQPTSLPSSPASFKPETTTAETSAHFPHSVKKQKPALQRLTVG
ncbi:hypothetical protein E2C01_086853 [Portunus trituberculatus]|uniref:Uncharacterized protein n=1 Tax=Portunus trituberculatus TaxID=210409 RepID=A0A5B7JHH4_PORTR|nr:hypothetical protein [Portunus trituberculatus]